MEKNFDKRTNDLENALSEACGTDAGADKYEEIRFYQGQLEICRFWLSHKPDNAGQEEITRILDGMEDFIVNHLSED